MTKEEIDTITDLLFGNGYDMLKTITDLNNKLKEKDKEIERLNNIINELEKLIDSYEIGKYDYQIPVFVLKDKIKSLKEGK